MKSAKFEIPDDTWEMFSLYPGTGAQYFANNSYIVLEDRSSREKSRVKIERNGKDIEGEEDGAFPKGEREGGDSFGSTLHGRDGLAHLRVFNIGEFIFGIGN